MQATEASKPEQDGETHISAQEYHDAALQEFNFNFHLKLFAGILPQAKKLFEIMQTKCKNIRWCSRKALFVLSETIKTIVYFGLNCLIF